MKASELFVQRGSVIVGTKGRDGKNEKIRSTRGLLKNDIRIPILTKKETSLSAELFTAALKENREAKIIGEKTLGEWNTQMLEILPTTCCEIYS